MHPAMTVMNMMFSVWIVYDAYAYAHGAYVSCMILNILRTEYTLGGTLVCFHSDPV